MESVAGQVVCFLFMRIVPPSAGLCTTLKTLTVTLPGKIFGRPLSPSTPLQEPALLALSEIPPSELCFEKDSDTFKV